MKKILPLLVALCVARAAYAQPAPPTNAPPPAQPAVQPAPKISLVPCAVGQKYKMDQLADAELPAATPIQFMASNELVFAWQGGTFAVHPKTGDCIQILEAGQYTVTAGGARATLAVKGWYDVLADLPIQEEGNFWLPKAVNEAADDSDLMFMSVLALSVFFFVAITVVIVYFVIKYRHRPGHKPEPSSAHNDALEITWTVIPTIIVVFLFYFGWRSYIRVVTPPQKAVEIQVLAKRWAWNFTHSNGVTDSDLHVPVNTAVRLVMTSTDVLHSFYAPAMRVKQDVVPRRYTYAWFEATKPGTYRLTCAEYCGTDHSQMSCLAHDKESGACLRRAVVVVHDPGDYERYLADKQANEQNMDPEKLGAILYDKKGCAACHTVDGTPRVGPSWKSPDWGQEVEMSDGKLVKIDETYIRESIEFPQAKARKHDPAYPPSMPSMQGQLKEKEIQALIAYIKSLKTAK
jgi:cytochrome c oxidase subunit 2